MTISADEDRPNAPVPWRPLLCGAALVVTTVALLGPLVNETRIWDDDRAIFANPALLPPSRAALRGAWLSANQSQYNPLTHTLWWGVAHVAYREGFWGRELSARVYHVANLLVHLLASLAVFALLRRLVRADFAAWAGATVFAIHPVQVETVAWIFGMRDVLCGMLCVVASHEYVAAVTRPGGNVARWRYAAALLAFACALLSKSAAVVLPPMLMLIDVLVLRRPVRASIRAALPFALLAIPAIVWMPFVQPAGGAATVRRALRPLVAADALAFYLWKLVWPFDLAVDYGRTPPYALARGWLWWTWLAPAAVAAGLLALRRRAPGVVTGAILFVVALLPVLGLKRFDFQGFSTVADHYLYLPMLGVALAAAAVVARAPRLLAWAIVIPVLLAMAWRTHDQTRAWESPQELWRHTARVNPRSWSAYFSLADLALRENRAPEAEAHARRAIELGGDYFHVRTKLAQTLERQGRVDEALEQYRLALAHQPDMPRLHLALADAYARAGRMRDAAAALESAVAQHPGDADLRRRLDELRARTGTLDRPVPRP